MGATPFTEVVHVGPDDQALRANAGDMIVYSLERRPPEKPQRFSGDIALVETVRGSLAETSCNTIAGGDCSLPIAGGPPNSLVPMVK